MKRLVSMMVVAVVGVCLFGPHAFGAPADELQQAAVAEFQQEFPQARLHQEGARITRVYGTPMTWGSSPADAADGPATRGCSVRSRKTSGRAIR